MELKHGHTLKVLSSCTLCLRLVAHVFYVDLNEVGLPMNQKLPLCTLTSKPPIDLCCFSVNLNAWNSSRFVHFTLSVFFTYMCKNIFIP